MQKAPTKIGAFLLSCSLMHHSSASPSKAREIALKIVEMLKDLNRQHWRHTRKGHVRQCTGNNRVEVSH